MVGAMVAEREGDLRTYRVARLCEVHLLPQSFTRRADFNLQAYWRDHLQSFMESFSAYACTLRIHPERLAFVKWLMPGQWQQIGEADSAGWVVVRLMLDSPLLAKMLVFGLGADAEVIDPPALAIETLHEAVQLVQHLSPVGERS